MKYAFAVIAAAGLAASAQAQNTRLVFETSLNGTDWSANVNAPATGGQVHVRIRAVFDAAGTSFTSMGFGGITFQPTLSNFRAGDARDAFTINLAPGDTGNGRRYPFSSVGQISSSASGELTTFVDGGTTLRFAGSKVTTPPGTLSWGLNSAQSPQSLNATGYNSSLDVVIFKYSVTLGANSTTDRVLTASAPLAFINNARGTWFTTAAGTGPVQAAITEGTIAAGTITQPAVPTPASLALLGLGGLVAGRRRR